MKLEENRSIALEKLGRFLLSELSKDGASKANFLVGFGYDLSNERLLAEALLKHPTVNDVVRSETNEFGLKKVVECHLSTPDGRDPCVRTVWQRDFGDEVYRLITMVPLTRRRDR